MPGVTYGEKWSRRNTRGSDFGSYSSRNMSPQRKHDMKNNSVSQYSNGYSSDRTGDVRDDYPTYLLEHLATFSVGPQYGIQTPKDGLRRLLQMEKSSGIWTQKMQMRLEKKWIVIIDNENGDIVERFPMNLIAEPTSYTSNDPRELYNNVIVFIVKDDPKNKNHNPPEMHIFQCARVSAQEVVNEMKMFINGKWKPGHRERYIPPPPTNPPPEPPVNGVNVREQVNLFNAVAAAAASPPRGDGMIQRVSASGYHKIDRMDNSSDRIASYSRDSNDETSSTSSEKYERDVAILNHCFDDIERFIARLQHAAAAFKELERRQKSRKNKKKDMGDGMLSMRAKPPSEREFVDVLQKFKLSFNLLAKLKNHIHDPNAPELVHFLFTPLALIVDAAKDSNYSTALASRVVAPLLTRDAIELLMNCCTSKESDLWHSLGDSWIVPRDQWKSLEGTYHPVFSDGWAPENPFSEKRERAEATAAAAVLAQKYRREDTHRSQEEQSEMRHSEYRVPSRQDRESRYGSEFHYSDRGDRERPLSPLHAPEPPQSSFENRFYDQSLEVPRRDPFDRNGAITPVSDHDFADHRDRDMRSDFSADSIDHVNPLDPHRQFETQQKQWLDDMKSRDARIVQVMYPRTANNDKELTVVRGELLEVIDDSRKWWKARNARGQVAHVPHTIVGPLLPAEDDTFNNPIYGSRGNGAKEPYYTPSDSPVGRDRPSENGHRDGAPVQKSHPPIPTPAPADWIKRERQGKKDKTIYEEIEAVVTIDESHGSPPKQEALLKFASKSELSHSIQKSKTLPKSANMMDTLHEELKMRVTLGPKGGKKYGLVEHQSLPVTYISPQSSPEEIQLWLISKAFSAKAQQMLQNMKGEKMFTLSESQMEQDLGSEEGKRLHKQMMIQKNACGFKTWSAKELSSILEARRKRIDPDDFAEEKKEECRNDGEIKEKKKEAKERKEEKIVKQERTERKEEKKETKEERKEWKEEKKTPTGVWF